MAIYNADADFDTGIQDVINALLMSQKFLFVYYASPQSQVSGQAFSDRRLRSCVEAVVRVVANDA